MSKAMEPDLQSPLGRVSGKAAKEWSHPSDNWLRGFVLERGIEYRAHRCIKHRQILRASARHRERDR